MLRQDDIMHSWNRKNIPPFLDPRLFMIFPFSPAGFGCFYLRGEEGPAVGGGAAAACAVAAVRHRPLLAQVGTARNRSSFDILQKERKKKHVQSYS